MKPGYRSTEFWLALFAQLLAAFLAAGVLPETHMAVKVAAFIAAALAALGYTASRTALKKAETDPGVLK